MRSALANQKLIKIRFGIKKLAYEFGDKALQQAAHFLHIRTLSQQISAQVLARCDVWDQEPHNMFKHEGDVYV